MRALVLFIAVVSAALGAPTIASGAVPPFKSGPLVATVTEAPFSLELTDTKDGDRLATVPGAPNAPNDPRGRYGTLGYSFDLRVPVVNNAYFGYYAAAEAESVWFHATRVRSWRREGASLVVVADTNDPLGHRLELTLAPRGSGGIAARSRIEPGSGPLASQASVSGAAFQAVGGERYLGFGERSNAADQTGNRVFSWAEEGPYGAGDYDERLHKLVPDFTFPTGPTASNFPIPWLVSTRGLGVLIDQPQRSTFDLLNEDAGAWHAQAEAPELDLTVFAGPRPADVVRRYSAYAGRQPRPSGWLFGPWVQFREDWPERFRKHDVPATVGQTYTHYLPCGAQRGKDKEERAQVQRYHRLGYRITTYFNPHVCTSYSQVYDEAARNGWLVKNRAGQPYTLSNPFTADQVIAEIDFTNPGARGLFKRLLDQAIDVGYDGWMEDFGEYTPTDSVFSNGKTGLEMHNQYPVLYHGASTEETARRGGDFAVFVRSGWHGAQRNARVVWGGDPTEDWSCSDGLCAALHQALSTGLSGIAYQGSDIGGFHAIANPRTSDELNARWLELGAVSGVMRTQSNGYSFRNDRDQRSQVWSPKVLPIWRRHAKLRTQLYPYLQVASDRYQRDGMPLARHLALVYPRDARAVRRQDELMLGDDLLAAPVIVPGARSRRLYLPGGRWIFLPQGLRYQQRSGAFHVGRATTIAGGRELTVRAPLDELPLFARAGSLIGLLPSDVDTLAGNGSERGLVHLRDRRRHLRVMAFPRGSSVRTVAPGVRVSAREARRGLLLRFRAKQRYRLRLEASMATLRRPFRPCGVRVKGKRLRHRYWRYDPRGRVLNVRMKTRAVRVSVRRCRRSPGR